MIAQHFYRYMKNENIPLTLTLINKNLFISSQSDFLQLQNRHYILFLTSAARQWPTYCGAFKLNEAIKYKTSRLIVLKQLEVFPPY